MQEAWSEAPVLLPSSVILGTFLSLPACCVFVRFLWGVDQIIQEQPPNRIRLASGARPMPSLRSCYLLLLRAAPVHGLLVLLSDCDARCQGRRQASQSWHVAVYTL